MSDYIVARRAPWDDAKELYPAEMWRQFDILTANYGIRRFDPMGEDHIYRLK